jgi:hypothetical protein
MQEFLYNDHLNKVLPNRLNAVKFLEQLIEAGFQYLVKYRWSVTKDGYVYFVNTGNFYGGKDYDPKRGWDIFDNKIYKFEESGEHISFNSIEEMMLYHYNLPNLINN